jgi:hypothetical protein
MQQNQGHEGYIALIEAGDKMLEKGTGEQTLVLQGFQGDQNTVFKEVRKLCEAPSGGVSLDREVCSNPEQVQQQWSTWYKSYASKNQQPTQFNIRLLEHRHIIEPVRSEIVRPTEAASRSR